MKLSEVKKGVIVLHDRPDQTRGKIKNWINKVGIIVSDELSKAPGYRNANLVRVLFLTEQNTLKAELVAYPKLKRMAADLAAENYEHEAAKDFFALAQ